MKFRDKESPICATENIPLFVLYLKNKLTKEQQLKVDKHIQECKDCLMNFAYVEEILSLKHPLSSDEKSLLLKYINDPLWYQSINEAKKHLHEEILGEVKELLKQSQHSFPATTSNTSDKGIKHNNSNNKSDSNIPNNNQPVTYQKYLYIALTLVIIIFLFLSSSIILITTKHINLESSLLLRPIKSTPNITNSQQSSSPENTLYQQLDSAIDEFLSTQNRGYLIKASSIANNIEDKYQDKYGVDLLAYYNSVPPIAINQLLAHRKKLAQLTNQATGDDYKQRLEESQKLEKQFLSFGNLIEAYKTKALINKLHVQLHNEEIAKTVTEDGLKFSTEKKYLLLEADFLLWKAKRLCDIPDFVNAEESFLKVIELGNTFVNSRKEVSSFQS